MKMLDGQWMISRPCKAQNPPTRTAATPTIARMPLSAPMLSSLLALQPDQRSQPADPAPDQVEKPASDDCRREQHRKGRQRPGARQQQPISDQNDDRLMDDVKGKHRLGARRQIGRATRLNSSH